MSQIVDFNEIYRDLVPITEFNESTSLCLYAPQNKLFVVKKEDKSAKSIYDALVKISSFHLAKVHYVAEENDHIEIVQDYISGVSLDELLMERGTLTDEETKHIIADICDGLSVLHKNGLVHRDINPNNIVITQAGSAIIIDYGIARKYDTNKHNDTTILGTPGYAAPEQFGFSQSSFKADIYAVGVLMNVMLTGELPNVRPAKGSLSKIIAKCIEIDSKKRFNSIDELNASIKNCISYNGPADKIIRQIPGLRSKKIPVIIFAVLAYIAVLILSIMVFLSAWPAKIIGTLISWLLVFAIPFCCFHNFLGFWDKFPLTKKSSKRRQKIFYIMLGIASVVIGLIVYGLINAPN